MMLRKRFVVLSLILVTGLLLSGCNYQIQRATPTVDPIALQATVNAAVAQAVQATAISQTGTALAMPTSTATATATLEPTATETATATATSTATPQPTATIQVIVITNTFVPTVAKPTATPTTAPYTCTLTSTSPSAGTKMNTGNDFDAVWKVKNTGTKDWQPGYVDLVYVSGTKMQTKGDVFDVNVALAKGAETTITLDMLAPGSAGKYTDTFALVMEGVTMCTLTVNIEAVAP